MGVFERKLDKYSSHGYEKTLSFYFGQTWEYNAVDWFVTRIVKSNAFVKRILLALKPVLEYLESCQNAKEINRRYILKWIRSENVDSSFQGMNRWSLSTLGS